MGVLGSAFATVAREAAMAATLATGLNAQEPAFTSPNPAVEVTAPSGKRNFHATY